ncbi:MAG: MoxR family ATPase [Planctomycetota bacterium]|nr:MoxR family ATPase [Planctomycetota bacterium]
MTTHEEHRSETQTFCDTFNRVRQQISELIVGQRHVIDATLTALICGGNVLLEGVPGLGKTELAKAVSQVLDLQFRRIQFTPDLMPADILGTNVMTTDEHGRYKVEFREGPVFTQLLLADEINRATPKTQSALLETMQEGTVTVGGSARRLKQPFFVLATQNPIEQEGTYPLPEAQLDRFLFKIVVPYPDRSDLNEVIERTILRRPVTISSILNSDSLLRLRETLDKVVVAGSIRDYAVRLVLSTHPESEEASERVRSFVRWGASPRAAQALVKAARVRALTEGRAQVAFEDVRHFAAEVLQHRILLNYDGQADGVSVNELVSECVETLSEDASTNAS